MMRLIYIYIILFFSQIPITLEAASNSISINNVRITPVDERIKISFTTKIDKKAVKSDYTLTLTPILVNGSNQVKLRSLTIQGKNARISGERKKMSGRKRTAYSGPIYADNGSNVLYLDTIPYEPWMEGAQLILQKESEGCCNVVDLPDELLADNVEIRTPEPVKEVIEISQPTVIQTTGDRLSAEFPYVIPVGNDANGQQQNEVAMVYYRINQSEPIEPDYMDNKAILEELTTVINTLSDATDTRIERIEIIGYASPEGPLELNNRLALNRATTLKKYLGKHTRVKEEILTASNGSENWDGLRTLVADSDIPSKDKILHIIDHTPVWNAATQTGRLGQLMLLDKGTPYRYMQEHFFPKLRNATCVRIYFKNL